MTSILKLKTPSGGSISLQPTDTAALLTQSLPAESGTVLLKETAAENAVYVPAGTGAVATTVQGKLRESVSVFDFGAHSIDEAGYSTFDSSAAFQLALDSGQDIDLFGKSFNVNNLTQSIAGQSLVSSQGVAKLYKNANGPVLTSSGDSFRMSNVEWRDDADAYTGDGVVASGNNTIFDLCGGFRILGVPLKVTGSHTQIRGTCSLYYTRTASGYDIEVGTSGVATLYHDLTGIYTSQSGGGILLTSTGTANVSGSQFGKLTCVSGGAPSGSGGPRVVSNRINGAVTTDQSNGIFTANQFAADVTLSSGATYTSIDKSNAWSGAATLINNTGNAVNAEYFLSGKASTMLVSGAQVTRFGTASSLAYMAAHEDTGAFEFFGQLYAQKYTVPNNTGIYYGKSSAGVDLQLAKVDSSNNLYLGSNSGNSTYVYGAAGGIYTSVGGAFIGQWYNSGLRPNTDNTFNLGTSTQRWSSSYATTFYPGAGAVKWTSGAGTPEASVTAPVGSLYTRTDGGAGTTLYVKETGTGNTGWVAK